MTKDQLSTSQLGAWRAFLTAYASVTDRLQHDLISAGCVSLISYNVLTALSETPNQRLSVQEIATKIHSRLDELIALLDQIEIDGYITLERNRANPPETSVTITESGLAEQQRASSVYARRIHQCYISVMDEIELEHFETSLTLMTKAASKELVS